MKLHHFAFVFVIIMIATIVITDIRSNELEALFDNKQQIDRNIDTAIDDCAIRLAEVDGNNHIIVNKDAAINSFFLSLYSAFGVMSDKAMQEKLNLYVPVITVTMEDGYYIFYSDRYEGEDGNSYIAKRWSEKKPYYYEDEDFVYGFTLGDIVNIYDKNGFIDGKATTYTLDFHDFIIKSEYAAFRSLRPNSILLNEENFELVRKATIIDCIEESMAHYTSNHNQIAQQYGISYSFALPVIRKDEWAPFLDDVSIFIVFQGYPYENGRGETYNRFASAGAKVSKNDVYYIEQKGWYLIYHKMACPQLDKDCSIVLDEVMYEEKECIKKGSYACPSCIPNGVYAPLYTP